MGFRESVTSTSFPHCLQLHINTAMHYGIEAEDRFWRHCVVTTFRADATRTWSRGEELRMILVSFVVSVWVKLFKRYNKPHTRSRGNLPLNLESFILLSDGSCVNATMYCILEEGEKFGQLYNPLIFFQSEVVKRLNYIPHSWNGLIQRWLTLKSFFLLSDWIYLSFTMSHVLEAQGRGLWFYVESF